MTTRSFRSVICKFTKSTVRLDFQIKYLGLLIISQYSKLLFIVNNQFKEV